MYAALISNVSSRPEAARLLEGSQFACFTGTEGQILTQKGLLKNKTGVLVQCRTLSRLDLACNALGDEGAGRLGCALRQVLSLLALLVQKYKY